MSKVIAIVIMPFVFVAVLGIASISMLTDILTYIAENTMMVMNEMYKRILTILVRGTDDSGGDISDDIED